MYMYMPTAGCSHYETNQANKDKIYLHHYNISNNQQYLLDVQLEVVVLVE